MDYAPTEDQGPKTKAELVQEHRPQPGRDIEDGVDDKAHHRLIRWECIFLGSARLGEESLELGQRGADLGLLVHEAQGRVTLSLFWEDPEPDLGIPGAKAIERNGFAVAVAEQATTLIIGPGNAVIEQKKNYLFRGIGEEMELHRSGRAGGAVKNRSHQSGVKFLQRLHGVQGRLSETPQLGGMLFAKKQPLVFAEGLQDNEVFRKESFI